MKIIRLIGAFLSTASKDDPVAMPADWVNILFLS